MIIKRALALISVLASVANAIPVGIWGGNGVTDSLSQLEDLTDEYGFNILVTTSYAGYAVNTILPRLKQAGWQAVLRFADYKTVDADDTSDCTGDDLGGKFSYDAWVESIVERKYFDFQEEIQGFIDDGTLLAVMVLDDVRNYGEFGWDVCDPTIEDMKNMGKFIKDNFPGVKTWIREDATELLDRATTLIASSPIPDRLFYIDGAISQFTTANSDPNTMPQYANENLSAAEQLGTKVVCGLNIADGGDGSSGQEGWRGAGFYTMTASEIESYGSTYIEKTCCRYMLLWEYDGEEVWPDGTIGADYFDSDPDYKVSTQALVNTKQCLCQDGTKYLHKVTNAGIPKTRNCSWLAGKSPPFIQKICRNRIDYIMEDAILSPAQAICRATCNSCDICFENEKSRYTQNVLPSGNTVYKKCKFLSNQGKAKISKICNRNFSKGGYPKPKDVCPKTCGVDHCRTSS